MKLKSDSIKTLGTSQAFHSDVFMYLLSMKNLPSDTSLEDLADLLGCLKKIHASVDDIKKQIFNAVETLTSEICNKHMLYMADKMMEGDDVDASVTGEYFIATPSIKQTANIPSRTSVEYLQLMRFICSQNSTPEELVGSDILRPHWPAFTEMLTKLQSEGRPLPEGISAETTKPLPSCAIRDRKIKTKD